MKKILSLSLVLMLVLALFAGCANKPATTPEEPAKEEAKSNQEPAKEEPKDNQEAKYKDGIYFAQQEKFDEKTGFKYMATIEVKDGKIVSAEWNGANIEGGLPKIELSKSGGYPMVENGGAQAPWHEQASKAEAYLLETQDPTKINYTDNEGHTDAISGVSIHVKEFFDLAKEALDNGPVGKGKYEDGHYYAEQKSFDNGWKDYADLTVVNGYIVSADWDGINEKGGDTKDVVSANGGYPMVEQAGAQAPWHEQADKAEAYLLDTQDPTAVSYSDNEGRTDAISGVSIHVKGFFDLAKEALDNGPVK